MGGWKILFSDPGLVLRDPLLLGALLVNLIPIVGLFAWGWRLETLVVFYWLENVLLGAVTLARMAAAGAAKGLLGIATLAFGGPFFVVHYGLFCFVHGIFVLGLFAAGPEAGLGEPTPEGLFDLALQATPNWPIALGAIAALKALSFAIHFLGRGDYRRSNPFDEMGRPYGRIMLLHFGIFAGGFALMGLGKPIWGVLILAGLKTLYDLQAAIAEDRRDRDGLKVATSQPPPANF